MRVVRCPVDSFEIEMLGLNGKNNHSGRRQETRRNSEGVGAFVIRPRDIYQLAQSIRFQKR